MNTSALTLIIPLITLGLFEVFLYVNKFIYPAIVIVLLLLAYTSWRLVKESRKSEKWINFFIEPAVIAISSAVFAILLANTYAIQAVFFLTAIFLRMYFRQAYYYLYREDRYKDYAIENFSSYGNFLAVFFFASAFFGLQSFFNIQITTLLPVFVGLLVMVFYQVLWANDIDIKTGLIFVAVGCLVLTELAWSFSFLSLSYLVVGLVFSLCYYVLIGVIRFYLKSDLTSKVIRMYLSFGFLSIIIILLTSRWV